MESDAAPVQSPLVFMLAGPTGIGKTELAVRLARRHRLEIISADSMQVYRGMEIGTGQPSAEQRAQARFHLCGLIDPREPFDVARFVEMCGAAHAEIIARGAAPLYVGGTGMYLRALRWGLFQEAGPSGRDPVLRAQLEDEIAAHGVEALHARMAAIDPASAARIAPRDAVRIVRALEVHALTGRRLSDLQTQWEEPRPRFPHRLVALAAPIAEVRHRIAARVGAMFEAGWVDETRRLLEAGVAPESHCFRALGYREILARLRGEIDDAAMRRLIVTRTGQFARRQMTWLRGERDVAWIDIGESASPASHGALAQLEILLENAGAPYV